MRNMTYAELGTLINRMSDAEKKMDATIFVPGVDEFFAVKSALFHADEKNREGQLASGVLDDGHPFFSI